MTREMIENLDNEIITEKQFREIEEHEEVAAVDCCGISGRYPDYMWYSVEFTDGTSINVYCD